jgi:N6-adenosine-specific RNA methylase IME4
MFPTQKKLEMFARITVSGWDTYGNEVEKYNKEKVQVQLDI